MICLWFLFSEERKRNDVFQFRRTKANQCDSSTVKESSNRKSEPFSGIINEVDNTNVLSVRALHKMPQRDVSVTQY